MYCEKCGNEMPADSKFCPRCGDRIDSIPSSSATPEIEKVPAPSPSAKGSKKEKKKRRGLRVVIALFFVLLLSAGGFAAWKMGFVALPWAEEKSGTQLRDYCISFARKYTVASQDSDEIIVEIEAPDFALLTQKALNDGETEVNKAVLEQYIKENPKLTKVYQVPVDSIESEAVEEGLLQRISDTQIKDDYLYFSYGEIAGTAHLYQGGVICRVKTDGSDFSVLAGSGADEWVGSSFLLLGEGEQKELAYIINGESVSLSLSDNSTRPAKTPVQNSGIPYFEKLDGEQPENEEIKIILADTGEKKTLVTLEDYESIDVINGSYYSEEDYQSIKNVEVVGDWVFFTYVKGVRDSAKDMGWRYAYQTTQTRLYCKQLSTSKISLLYEYGS